MQIADKKLFEADLCCPQQIKAKPICLKLKLKSKLGIQIVGENFKSAQKCLLSGDKCSHGRAAVNWKLKTLSFVGLVQ